MVRAVVVSILLALSGGAARAGVQGKEEGFVPLFNGKDFTGMKFFLGNGKADPKKTFRVEEGALICTGRPGGYWYTEKKYQEFTLRFDWRYKRPKDLKKEEAFVGNSGYLLWVNEHKVWPYSLETQGMNRQAGFIYFIGRKDESKNDFKYDDEARKKAVKPVGEWNTYEVVAKGDTVKVSINGTLVTTVTKHEYKKDGHIGFQSEGAEIHWKNIRIKPH